MLDKINALEAEIQRVCEVSNCAECPITEGPGCLMIALRQLRDKYKYFNKDLKYINNEWLHYKRRCLDE